MGDAKAALVLEDGMVFQGKPFGAAGEAFGQTVFYTGVVGYQELLTHPSYGGTLAVLTYPIIGSYGVNESDNESDGVHVRGIVVREYSRTFSNFRATGALEDFLKERGVVGIREVDTRAVTVHLRDEGEMRGAVVSGDFDPQQVARKMKATPSPFEEDLVSQATWAGSRPPQGAEKHRLAVLNLGVTESLLGQLGALGCSVQVLAASAGPKDLLASDPEGVIVAGGPGDPHIPAKARETVTALVGKVPILGIALGHEVLALALGCRVKPMKAGHRGLNYPVRDLPAGRSHITVQHHSFVVDGEGVPEEVEVTHKNLNDGSVEGIQSRTAEARGVQFHPSPDETGGPSAILRAFIEHK
ncbi:MAG: glutamine-hydrolyzing carbamoyl-phosphate synthase small subunit [Phycisphaerae bacterium]|nr:glutamine-hydrolyzing carbamoyl-phosphate synthase small subunit [Phycisphaerae bacterium]